MIGMRFSTVIDLPPPQMLWSRSENMTELVRIVVPLIEGGPNLA